VIPIGIRKEIPATANHNIMKEQTFFVTVSYLFPKHFQPVIRFVMNAQTMITTDTVKGVIYQYNFEIMKQTNVFVRNITLKTIIQYAQVLPLIIKDLSLQNDLLRVC
jgi:hypothetical protein